MQGGNAQAKLITLTARMNSTRVLVSGEVPLTRWLQNAILLSDGMPEETVFRKALERASVDGSAPPTAVAEGSAEADLAELPVGESGLEITIEEDDTLDVGF